MMICPECRMPMTSTKQEAHRYRECGLSNVTLKNVDVHSCPFCGEAALSIPRLGELHELIAFTLVQKETRLAGEDVRFLRKYLGWSAVQFASIMGVSRETVSRWETDAAPMGTTAERLLRLMVFRLKSIEDYRTEELAALGVVERAERSALQLTETADGWVITPPAG